jgi:hypothetical protein
MVMTDAITIPHEALVTAAKQVGHYRFGKQWDCLTLYEQGLCYVEARAACLAMLRSWPGRNTESRELLNFGNNIDGPVIDTRLAPFILLPLTEPSDGK